MSGWPPTARVRPLCQGGHLQLESGLYVRVATCSSLMVYMPDYILKLKTKIDTCFRSFSLFSMVLI